MAEDVETSLALAQSTSLKMTAVAAKMLERRRLIYWIITLEPRKL